MTEHRPQQTTDTLLNKTRPTLCVCGKRANHGTPLQTWIPMYGDKS